MINYGQRKILMTQKPQFTPRETSKFEADWPNPSVGERLFSNCFGSHSNDISRTFIYKYLHIRRESICRPKNRQETFTSVSSQTFISFFKQPAIFASEMVRIGDDEVGGGSKMIIWWGLARKRGEGQAEFFGELVNGRSLRQVMKIRLLFRNTQLLPFSKRSQENFY